MKIFIPRAPIVTKKEEMAMWPKAYRDYKTDEPLIKERVEPGKGIIGCEMHDLNGWGLSLHIPKKKKRKNDEKR